MIVSIFALLLISSTFAVADNPLPYTGVRVTFPQAMITNTIHTSLGKAVSGVAGNNFGDYVVKFGSGFFTSSFTAQDFTCGSASYNQGAAQNPTLTITNNVITQNLNGPIMTFSCQFSYFFTLLGMTLIGGDATATMQTSATTVTQTLSNSSFLSTVGGTMLVNVVPSGFGWFGGINSLASFLINGGVLPDLSKMLGQLTTTQSAITWDSWLNVKHSIYPDGSLDIILKNSFRTVMPMPASFVTFGFNTVLRVANNPLIANHIKRVINSNVTMGSASCQICLAASVISHILETRKVSKDFLIPIDPKQIGLSGTVRDMFNIIPKLAERMPPSLGLSIGCGVSAVQLVRIADPTSTIGLVRAQASAFCTFESERGEVLLTTYMRIRGNLQNTVKMTNNTWSIEGGLASIAIYDLNSDRAVDGTTTLYGYISSIIQLLNGQVSTTGLTVNVPFGNYAPKSYTMTTDEYCINLS